MHNLKLSRLLLLSLMLCTLAGNAQIKLQSYTSATDTFYWKRYTHIPRPQKLNLRPYVVVNPGKVVDTFLARNPDQFPQFTGDSLPKYSPGKLKKCLYPVDINGDNRPDIIFSGYGGGETPLVRIYLNRGDSFELVFEDYQYITRLKKKEGKLTDLSTGDVGSGDNYLYFTRDYKVNQEHNVPEFIKVKQHVAYRYTEEPVRYYSVPVPFIAKADTMLLRASAARLNEPFFPKPETFGNIVAKYRSKAKGMVLAIKSYGKGNDWYFVEVYPGTMPTASILYDLDRLPSFIRGWVSGQSILLDLK
ncbi:MAG: VCBS repeat-containing protein [Bacteroidota bacterium]